MTIVAGADTGILITGATKPVAPEIPILEDAADNISHMRVGDEFGSVIGTCSKEVWNLFESIRSKLKDIPISASTIDAEKIIELHEGIVNAPKLSDTYTRIPSSLNGIKSWAFGDDFKDKSPCIRCQRLYSEWFLHKRPDSPEKKLARLREDDRSSSIKYTPSRKYKCSYCAETIAAAKLYAIKHGTLTLTLFKDKDEIKGVRQSEGAIIGTG
jgi:hypothetical protein